MSVLRNISLKLIPKLLRRSVKTYLLRCRFKESILHDDVLVDAHSKLGRYNVLFNRVCLVDSSIGDHTYVQQDSQIISATIGKFCSIGMRVNIGLPRHAIETASSHPIFYLKNTPLAKTYCVQDKMDVMRHTIIGHDVWIGQSAMVMGGVRIGTGAVIGAGAVVTKDVPDYGIVVGVPAKILRYRFEASTRQRLLASKWWEMSEEWLQLHVDNFLVPEDLLVQLEKNPVLVKEESGSIGGVAHGLQKRCVGEVA